MLSEESFISIKESTKPYPSVLNCNKFPGSDANGMGIGEALTKCICTSSIGIWGDSPFGPWLTTTVDVTPPKTLAGLDISTVSNKTAGMIVLSNGTKGK